MIIKTTCANKIYNFLYFQYLNSPSLNKILFIFIIKIHDLLIYLTILLNVVF